MNPERAYYVYGNEIPDNSVPQITDIPQKKKQEKFSKFVNPDADRLESVEKQKLILKYVSIFSLFTVLMLYLVGYSYASAQRADIKLQRLKERYDIYYAENKELNTKLNALVASVNIDEIAVDELGMVKIMPENEFYLDVERGNTVIDLN